jgi:hypothetical protein
LFVKLTDRRDSVHLPSHPSPQGGIADLLSSPLAVQAMLKMRRLDIAQLKAAG